MITTYEYAGSKAVEVHSDSASKATTVGPALANTTPWVSLTDADTKTEATLFLTRPQAIAFRDGLAAWLDAHKPADAPPLVKTGQGEYEEVHHG